MTDPESLPTPDDASADRSSGHREHYREALSAVGAGRFAEAIPALRLVLAAAPEDVQARVLLGSCLAEEGQSGAAEGMLRSATAIDPTDIAARLRLGELLLDLVRPGEALGEYRAVLTIDPDHPTARKRVVELSDPRR